MISQTIYKSIKKISYNNGSVKYKVHFSYQYTFQIGSFKVLSFVRNVIDRIDFNTYDEAEDYIDHVDYPSKWKKHEDMLGVYPTYYTVTLHCKKEIENKIKKVLKDNNEQFEKIIYQRETLNDYKHGNKNDIYCLLYYNKEKDGNYVMGSSQSLKHLIGGILNYKTYTQTECITVKSNNLPKDVLMLQEISNIDKSRKDVVEQELKRIEEYKNHLESLL